MRITSILLLTFILLLSCKKDSGIPDKYSFLLGEWHCKKCNYDTMKIEKNRIIFKSKIYRENILIIKSLHSSSPYEFDNKWIKMTLNKKESFYVNIQLKDSILGYFKNTTGYYPDYYIKTQ